LQTGMTEKGTGREELWEDRNRWWWCLDFRQMICVWVEISRKMRRER